MKVMCFMRNHGLKDHKLCEYYNTYTFLEFFADKLFEHRPHHVKQEWLTNNVHFFHAEWHGFLYLQIRKQYKYYTALILSDGIQKKKRIKVF